jgi:uncharacterized protein (DUF2147 family)
VVFFSVRKLGGSLVKCLVLSLVIAAQAPAAVADSIVGLWRTDPTDKGYAHVEVSREGELFEGRVVWLSQPHFPPGDPEAGRPKVDRLNPDPELRGQPIIGLPLMSGFRYVDGVWRGGRIYDPETGKTYKCVLRLGDDGKLKVRGYVGISLLGRTTVWERVDL